MKHIITILIFISIVSVTIISCSSSAQSDSGKQISAEAIAQKINSKTFVFEAREVSPIGRGSRQLTSYYSLEVSGDTLTSSLPYFGRAYSAPINPAEGGYNFVSTRVDYLVEKKDKGGWNIVMEPKDRTSGERFMLTAYANGWANLQVTSTNRQPISFRGRIR